VDPFLGVDAQPATLHRYAYAANDAVNARDPSGEFVAYVAVTQGNLEASRLRAEDAKMKLRAGASIIARACAIALIASAANAIAHGSLPDGFSGPCTFRHSNSMRVQLQESVAGTTLNTFGIPMSAPDPGVAVRTVQANLGALFVAAELLPWFPFGSQKQNLRRAIVLISARLNGYPPGGISGLHRSFETKSFGPHDRYRVDVDNLDGWNLRTLFPGAP
jgi:hypothetical protein